MAIVCGFNEFGQLDNFSYRLNAINTNLDDPSNLKTVDPLEEISDIKFGWNYCVIVSGDNVFLSGFIGNKCSSRKKLVVPREEKISQVACSRKHFLVLTNTGKCWRYTLANNQWSDLVFELPAECNATPNVNVTHIGSGETRSIAVMSSGWIYNIPGRISFLPEVVVEDVQCGKEHAVLLSDMGQVFTWGIGSRGQLGHGDLEINEQPRIVQALAGIKTIAISAGGWHTWVVTEEGNLYSWGWNCNGQLAFPVLECKVQTEPRVVRWPAEVYTDVDVDINTKVKKVACGSRHTVILLRNGLVFGCGWNNFGQLLLQNTTTDFDNITRLPVSDGDDIMCGAWNTAILKKRVNIV